LLCGRFGIPYQTAKNPCYRLRFHPRFCLIRRICPDTRDKKTRLAHMATCVQPARPAALANVYYFITLGASCVLRSF
jgi:hypothetical protein